MAWIIFQLHPNPSAWNSAALQAELSSSPLLLNIRPNSIKTTYSISTGARYAPIFFDQKWRRPVSHLCESVVPCSVAEVMTKSTEEVDQTLIPKGDEAFAVVMIGSHQYIVFPGRFIYTEKLRGANVNDKIVLHKVLLIGTRSKTYVGEPVVANAVVHAVVEEQGWDKEIIVFKFKRKKHYRRTNFHRQPRTRIRITGITGYESSLPQSFTSATT